MVMPFNPPLLFHFHSRDLFLLTCCSFSCESFSNGLEESTNNEVDVPLNEVSNKLIDPHKYGYGTPNLNKNTTLKLVPKVVHRTNEHRNAKREIDHQEKVFKKPDKVLPCPRCNSLETKFCYFNNYNVNQPRHFCKNCQRYWTAGGTIRNIPVGTGKRKNKHSAQYCQIPMTPDAASVIQTDSKPASDMLLLSNELPVTSRPIKGGEETPLSESLETVLSLNGLTKIEVDSSTLKDDDDEEPSSSSMRSSEIEQLGLPQHSNGLVPLHSFHYYHVPSWPYQWNPCWNVKEFRPSNISSRAVYTDSSTMMAVPGFSIPTVILPGVPYSYLGFMSSWAEQKEEASLVGSAFSGISLSSCSVSNSTCSGNRSPTLGKHPRDGSTPGEDAMKQNLWVPKTVRINDPEEAANSSIWSTLGTKSEQNKFIMKGSVFKSFEPKSQASPHILDDNQILRANPAAFSRSESFQERM
ncbi:hypothetical protein GLYMA_15G215500v4 [Glycine max]|uniref:Dof-type domain-containing protein n=1 Tax=Glycine max TaxID=3847 RepID=K7MCW1_SOYBN|nr:hypothetical protein GLYMA_15G215500v4 [Glycine max]KRH13096.1 hypothetical protein GLYMA_15G215500v4 [Glycine max]|eukprot:XP_006598004.1 cyclic dof factor 3 isoform X1 [Glycine max]